LQIEACESKVSSAKTKFLLFETFKVILRLTNVLGLIAKISFLSVAEERILNLGFRRCSPFSANDGLEARCHSFSAGLIFACSYE
jgi:hypothetical protein